MRCVICDSNDWENVDQYRIKPEGMSLCKSCGFVSYPSKWKTDEEIKAYYRKDYRNPPKINNWFSGQRKLHYHNAFLAPLFKEWKEKGLKPVICEIGAAYGLFLNFIREKFPEAEVYGTELTNSFRRNAYHEFGLNLTEDFDSSRKYDLIASYKVAEHQLDVDKLLRQYVECLNPDGKIYISVPTWFGRLNNFGASGFDIEYYYHPNHINAWTRKLFETLLKKVGLRVVAHNNTFYDDTYLCVRDDEQMAAMPAYEDVKQMRKKLEAVHSAGLAFMEGRFEDALRAWPDFPDAHISRFEVRRKEFSAQGFDAIKSEVIDYALSCCKDAPEIHGLAADLHMRFDKFQEAVTHLETMAQMRPGSPAALKGLSQCMRQLGRVSIAAGHRERGLKYFEQAREIMRYLRQVSDQDVSEATNWIYDDNSRIPTPFEVQN